ncbi:MAG: peptidyl-prolyl cis-trans isomerase, partial [Pseudomonadota bacterium]
FYHFLTPTQELAEEIIKNLKENSNHKDVASKFIDKKVISETFNNQSNQGFLSNIDSSIFNLKENDISSAIKSDLGWHVFKVIKLHPKEYKAFDIVKNEIRGKIHQKLTEQYLFELTRQVEDDIASGADFNDIAKRYNLTLNFIKDIAADGTSINNESVTIDADIVSTAFKTELTQESQIITLNDNSNMFIVKVDSIIAPKLKEFNSVKQQVVDLLAAKTRGLIAHEVITSLQTAQPQLNDANAIDSFLKPIYKKYNLSDKNKPIILSKLLEVKRTGEVANNFLNENLVSNVFSSNVNQSILPIKINDESYSFAIVKNIIASEEQNEAAYTKLQDSMNQKFKTEIYSQYLEYLRNKYPVEINLSILNNKADN